MNKSFITAEKSILKLVKISIYNIRELHRAILSVIYNISPPKFAVLVISRTNVASVGSVFNDTRKVKVLSLPETIKEKLTFRAKALRRELVATTNSRREASQRNGVAMELRRRNGS